MKRSSSLDMLALPGGSEMEKEGTKSRRVKSFGEIGMNGVRLALQKKLVISRSTQDLHTNLHDVQTDILPFEDPRLSLIHI